MDQPEKNPLSTVKSETQTLCEFLAAIRYESLPPDVVSRTEDFFLDWLASALAGKGARPVLALEKFAQVMGPATGPSEILTTRGTHIAFLRGAD
jgi:2-methylcitrate dehydratase PrpD